MSDQATTCDGRKAAVIVCPTLQNGHTKYYGSGNFDRRRPFREVISSQRSVFWRAEFFYNLVRFEGSVRRFSLPSTFYSQFTALRNVTCNDGLGVRKKDDNIGGRQNGSRWKGDRGRCDHMVFGRWSADVHCHSLTAEGLLGLMTTVCGLKRDRQGACLVLALEHAPPRSGFSRQTRCGACLIAWAQAH